MKRRILLVASLVVLALLAWWLVPGPKTEVREVPIPAAEAAADEPGRSAVDAPAESPALAADSAAGRTEAAQPAPGIAAPAPPPPVDKKARDWVHLIVQDRQGSPIPNADIRMIGMRTKRDPGSHWAWPVEPSIGRTALDGTAKLWFPVWVTQDDEAGELTFEVSHPDFVTQEVDGFVVGPEPRVVVLEHGAFVIVSGWIESPAEVIADVVPHLTWDVKLAQDAWQPIRDGRLSTANIPPGVHGLYLSHSSAERGEFFSAVERFTLAEAEQKEIHLRLLPAARLEGVVEDEVPRPVREGHVLLNLQIGTQASGEAKMLRSFSAPIREDGTFTVEGLPPGDGQIIALCAGWASERVVGERTEPGIAIDREAWIRSHGEHALIPQRVDPASGKRFVLKMEPTGALKATLRGPDGAPVAGVILSCWPNVFWLAGYSSSFIEGDWSATSDSKGELMVANVPWGTTWYGVGHPALDLPMADGDRTRQAMIEPGKTTEVALELEAKEK
jgi:hypothetical protein